MVSSSEQPERASTDLAFVRVVWAAIDARAQRGLLRVNVRLPGHLVPLLAVELELTTKHLPHEGGGRHMYARTQVRLRTQ